MSRQRIYNLISLIVCGFIFISTVIIVAMGLSTGPEAAQPGSEDMTGINYLKAFTVQSNILMGITSLIVVIFNFKNLLQNRDEMPYWAVILQFVSATGVCVTMMTTILFLAPTGVMYGHSYFWLFSGTLFFLHFLNPALVISHVMFLLKKHRISLKACLLGILPVASYSCFYIPLVLSGTWTDFYGFTFGGHLWAAPLSIMTMLGVSFLFAFVISLVHNKFIDE